jgi:pre-mRNA-splicing factor CWC22
MEVCQIILDSCAPNGIYEDFFGKLSEGLCMVRNYVRCFEKAFQHQYEIADHLGNIKLETVPKLFAHLLLTNSISWSVCIHF